MRCSITGCKGIYEAKEIVHTISAGDKIMVIGDLPAEVCTVCGDTLLGAETIRNIERLIENPLPTGKTVPLFDYANVVGRS